ncbi:MAG TPA: methylmalonyl-CoA mutase family protein, partial [Jatrophihabitantaceae bacterium]|nr:methylmalonyl-CoA mutase family protein [Jatrophihabitantaceae bacterium]
AAVESGYLKSALVSSLALRRRRIESGEDIVVGVNRFTESEPNPLLSGDDGGILTVDPAVEEAAKDAIRAWRAGRDASAVDEALTRLRDAAKTDENLMEASLACARVGVTVGEWAGVLREVFGEYRPPTGVAAASGGGHEGELSAVQQRVRALGEQLGRPLKFLVGKPGLDGHSNGAEQIAVRARDAGFEVVYSGIRLTPAQIVNAAVEEDVDVVGLSVLSGSHLSVVPDVVDGLREAGLEDVPVVVGGIIPERDAAILRSQGVARVFTPKDFEITDVLGQIVDAIEQARA